MHYKHRVVIAVSVPAVLIGAFVMLDRPREPRVTLGLHKANVVFVPINDVKRKPWFDFTLPLLGRVAYPNRPNLCGVVPSLDAENVVGYLVVDAGYAYWSPAGKPVPKFSLENDFSQLDDPPQSIVIVPRAVSGHRIQKAKLIIERHYPEIIDVSVEY